MNLIDHGGKRDRSNGYDATNHVHVVERFEAQDKARWKILEDRKLKELEERRKDNQDGVGDDGEFEDDVRVDEAKVDEQGRS